MVGSFLSLQQPALGQTMAVRGVTRTVSKRGMKWNSSTKNATFCIDDVEPKFQVGRIHRKCDSI